MVQFNLSIGLLPRLLDTYRNGSANLKKIMKPIFTSFELQLLMKHSIMQVQHLYRVER